MEIWMAVGELLEPFVVLIPRFHLHCPVILRRFVDLLELLTAIICDRVHESLKLQHRPLLARTCILLSTLQMPVQNSVYFGMARTHEALTRLLGPGALYVFLEK